MPLKLLPLVLDDFDTMVNHANIHALDDDLVGPPMPLCWPLTTPKDARDRLTFHMARQRDRFLGDTSARFMKVIDEDNAGEIVSIARWHWYPSGYSFDKEIRWETIEFSAKESPPTALNVALHNFILSSRDSWREGWIKRGNACWILMHMVTRSSQRGRGAAGMLIQWGIQQAQKDGVPAYLEAGAQGRPVYARHGFKQVGELTPLDLRPFGTDIDFVMARMAWLPGDGDGGLAADVQRVADGRGLSDEEVSKH